MAMLFLFVSCQRNSSRLEIYEQFNLRLESRRVSCSARTKRENAVELIFEEMEKLKREPISDSELEACKKNNIYFSRKKMESNGGIVDTLQGADWFGATPRDYIDIADHGINAVTKEEVLRVAKKYLPDRETGGYVLLTTKPGNL